MENKSKLKSYLIGFLILISINCTLACRGGTLISTGVTDQEKKIILQEHNKIRATVAMGRVPGQPSAENMREMVWDEELAQRAQEWANNCQFKHDPNRQIDRFTMGQNMAIIWSTVPLADGDGDYPSRIQSWFNEVQKYAFGAAWSPKTGHYSQLVWGETNLVGCGFAYYQDARKHNKLYVCNYGPGGNVVGSNPYEVGRPACSNYGMKPSNQYQGLCSLPGAGANQNAIDTTFSFKSYTNKKTTYNSQNPAQQPQVQTQTYSWQQRPKTQQPPVQPQQQQPQQQKPYQNKWQWQKPYDQKPQASQYYSKQSSYSTNSYSNQQQQQPQKIINPNYDYTFKSFFKQLAPNWS